MTNPKYRPPALATVAGDPAASSRASVAAASPASSGRGPNAAFYRVGFNLDAQGHVDMWGPWAPIPDWASGQDEGAGIAVADFGAQASLS